VRRSRNAGLDRDQFEFDRIRNAHLSAAGFILVHVTWSQVVRHPADVAERIVAVLQRWAPDVFRSWRAV
jgi:very-short-patch-repair endonuclease